MTIIATYRTACMHFTVASSFFLWRTCTKKIPNTAPFPYISPSMHYYPHKNPIVTETWYLRSCTQLAGA